MNLFSWFVSNQIVGRHKYLINKYLLYSLVICAIGHKSEWQFIQPVEAITLPAAVRMAVKANIGIENLFIEEDALFLSGSNNITATNELSHAETISDTGFAPHRSAEVIANTNLDTYTYMALRAVTVYLHALRQRELVALAGEFVEKQRNHLTVAQQREGPQKLTTAGMSRIQESLGSAQTIFSKALTKLADADDAFFHIVKTSPKYLVRPSMPEAPLMQELAQLLVAVTCLTRNEASSDRETNSSNAEPDSQALLKFPASADFPARRNNMRNKPAVFPKKHFPACLRNSSGLLVFQNLGRGMKTDHYWRALQRERMRLKVFRNDVKINHRVRNVFRRQFDRRQRTFSELLDAERELFDSKVRQVNSEFVEFFGIYKILAVAGLLPVAFRLGRQGGQSRDYTRHLMKSYVGCSKPKAGVVHHSRLEIPLKKSSGKDFVFNGGSEKKISKPFEFLISLDRKFCATSISSGISLAIP